MEYAGKMKKGIYKTSSTSTNPFVIASRFQRKYLNKSNPENEVNVSKYNISFEKLPF